MASLKVNIRKYLTFLTAATLLMSTVSAALFLSVPSDVQSGENATIKAANTFNSTVNYTLEIRNETSEVYNTTKTVDRKSSATDEINVSDLNLTGTYDVEARAENSTEDIDYESTSSFRVRKGVDNIYGYTVTGKSVSDSDCPLNSSMYGKCKVFGIETSVNTSSSLKNISESGRPLTATVEGKEDNITIGAVDTENPGDYDSLFWDDDKAFLEANETGDQEISYVGNSKKIKDVSVANTTSPMIVRSIGKKTLITLGLSEAEVPVDEGQSLSYLMQATSNKTPVKDRVLSASMLHIDETERTNITPNDASTNKFGVTGLASTGSLKQGEYRLNFDNFSSFTVQVKSFNINEKVLDASTGEKSSVFTPGDRIKVEASAARDGGSVTADTTRIKLVDPTGEVSTRTPSDGKAVFKLGSDAGSGTATVKIRMTVGNDVETESVDLDVKNFDSYVMPLKTSRFGPSRAQEFAPGSKGHLMVAAVNPGTFGSVQTIMEGKFYEMDNSSTDSDECTSQIGNFTDSSGNNLNVISSTSVNDSTLFAPIKDSVPDKMLSQCVVEFDVPNDERLFSGKIQSSRQGTEGYQKGEVSFAISKFDVDGRAVDTKGNFKWHFGSSQMVAIKPIITENNGYTRVKAANVTSMNIVDLGGAPDVSASNVSFVNQTQNPAGPFIKFNAPEVGGTYNARFRVDFKTLNSTGGVESHVSTGREFFEVELMDVDVDTVGNVHLIPPDQKFKMDVEVSKPSGSSLSGVTVKAGEVINYETQTKLTDEIETEKNITGSNGKTRIDIKQKGGWDEGTYSVRVIANNSNGKTDSGHDYFRVQRYSSSIDFKKKGCRYSCDEAIKGEILKLKPWLKDVRTSQEIKDYTINLSQSTLQFGDLGVGSETEIPVKKHLESRSDGSIKINTSGLSPGRYEANLHLETGGSTEIASNDFEVKAFDVSIDRLGNRHTFQPGENVTFQLNFSSKRDFRVKLDRLSSYQKSTSYNISETQPYNQKSFVSKSLVKYNVTVPSNPVGKNHFGELKVYSNGTQETDFFTFDVKKAVVGTPVSERLVFGGSPLSDEKKVESNYFDKNPSFSDDYEKCKKVFSDEEYSFSGTAPNGTCLIERDEDFSAETVKYNHLVHNSRVWISPDGTFNNEDDVAKGVKEGENFTGVGGVKWNVTEIGRQTEFDELNYTNNDRCSDKTRRWNLSVRKGISNDLKCWINDGFDLGGDEHYLLGVDNYSTVFISQDRIFNESGDLTSNLSIGETSSPDSKGLKWKLKSMNFNSRYEATIKSVNGFTNGVRVTSTSKDYFGDGWRLEKISESFGDLDLNDDGDEQDVVNVIGVKDSGSWEGVRLSFDLNFTDKDSLKLKTGENGTLNGTGSRYYLPDSFKDSDRAKKQVNIYMNSAGGLWSLEDRKPNTNISIPVVSKYPNGTPLRGEARVGEIIREKNDQEVSIQSSANATVDSYGMSFVEVNLTNPKGGNLGEYTVVTEVNTSNSQDYKEIDNPAKVDVELFSVDTDSLVKFGPVQLSNYTNTSSLEKGTGIKGHHYHEPFWAKAGAFQERNVEDCVEMVYDEDCSDSIQVVLQNESAMTENGLNYTALEMDDDKDLRELDETGGEPERVDNDELIANLTYMEPDLHGEFAIFNQTSGMLEYYDSGDVPRAGNVTLRVGTMNLEETSGLQSTVKVESVEYNGKTYKAKDVISEQTSKNGTAILEFSRSDFKGQDTKWPADEFMKITANASRKGSTHEFRDWVDVR